MHVPPTAEAQEYLPGGDIPLRPNGPFCGGCPLQPLATGFARTDGRGDLGILVVAEALGEEEARQSKPLVGGTGALFNRLLSRLHSTELGRPVVRDDFLLANVVNCRPPDNKLTGAPYESAAIAKCSPYLRETVAKFKPKAIITMGNTAMRWFTGLWGIDYLRGYAFETPWGTVIPTYHPAYIMRGNFELARVFQLDVEKAIYISRHGVPKLKKIYQTRPSLADAWAFYSAYIRAGMPLLSFDIETPYAKMLKDEGMDPVLEDDASYQILRTSFAFKEGEAISVPFDVTFKPFVRAMLATSGPKLVWNAPFDVPRLRFNGCPVLGRIYDGMVAFHFLEPSLPMGLKYAATFYCPDMPAWKLMSKESPEWYNAADSDVALRVFNRVKKALEKDQRWTVFERHCVDLLQRLDKASARGVNVDRLKRASVREDFIKRYESVLGEIQPLVPLALKPKTVFKLSKERLEKEGKWSESMVLMTEELTEKELSALRKREARETEVAKKKALREMNQLHTQALKEWKQRNRSLSSALRRRKKGGPVTTAQESQ